MKLSGHHLVTTLAVRDFAFELRATLPSGSDRNRSLHCTAERWPKSLPDLVVRRDVIDVVTAGHWVNSGQKHHFMRRFDGQSPLAAYEEGCD